MQYRYVILGVVFLFSIVSFHYLFMEFGSGSSGERIILDYGQERKPFTASVGSVVELPDDIDAQSEEGVAEKENIEIIGDVEIDTYIRAIAETRGYERQPLANEEELSGIGGHLLEGAVIEDFRAMQGEMEELGMDLTLVSAYRSPERQREIFLHKLGEYDREELLSGELDTHIDSILSVSSIPGYSKHHSGRAIDLGCGNYELDNTFVESDCYKWLSQNDFENAGKYNFHPSYPFGVENQGPDPESWEFVWGEEL